MAPVRVKRIAARAVFALSVVMLVAGTVMEIAMADPTKGPNLGNIGFNVLFAALPVTGILIARRHPENAIAWILLAVGLVIGFGAVADPYSTYGLILHPGSLPAAGVVRAISGALWVPTLGLIGTFLLLLFPDGRLPSRRWLPVAWLSGVTMGLLVVSFVFAPGTFEEDPSVTNPLGVKVLAPVLPAMIAALPVLPLCILLCALSLVMRFRRSRGIERLQVKWLASGAAMAASVYLLMMVISWLYNLSHTASPIWLQRLGDFSVLTFLAIPVAICIAVNRYGLFGIDRLISRTLSYAVITGTLLAVYLLLVTSVSQIAPASSSLAVAASTLAVAALFQPLRRRVQKVVDRRFNRARYDADRTLEAFTRTLRQEVDLDAVSSDLIAAVHHTLQPTTARLWLRQPGGGG
jgi:hypothetical protein